MQNSEQVIWKPLIYRGHDYGDSFEISNDGQLRNIRTGKLRKLNINKRGYYDCVISQGRGHKPCIKIHRAVAENFVDGNHDLFVNHKDCNKLNNHYTNLEFVTNKENIYHALAHDLLKGTKPIMCLNNGMKFKSIGDAVRWCGLKSNSSINCLFRNTNNKTAGRHPETGERLRWKLLKT